MAVDGPAAVRCGGGSQAGGQVRCRATAHPGAEPIRGVSPCRRTRECGVHVRADVPLVMLGQGAHQLFV